MNRYLTEADYNPAVSLATLVRGRLPSVDFAMYVLFQIGALLAAVFVPHMTRQTFAPHPGADVGPVAAVAAEFLFTFVLVSVVLQVAMSPKTEGDPLLGDASRRGRPRRGRLP